MTSPAITVGLPFHDERRGLVDAIRSVFAQTFTDWELVMVDDGSTDGSLDLARKVNDPRVRLVSDGARRRLPGRLNEIAALARGDLVARLDADDMMHPARLERELAVLRANPAIDVVGTSMYSLDERDRVIAIDAEGPIRADPFHVLRKGLISHATMLARRAWLRENPYDERYPRAEDRELFARTCRALRFEHLAEPLYLHGRRKDVAHTLDNYRATTRDNRRIFRAHAAWPLTVVPLVAESVAKEAVFRLVTALGAQEVLLARRGRRPTHAEREEAGRALRVIRTTRVPGIDP